jgi:hypothetical protein
VPTSPADSVRGSKTTEFHRGAMQSAREYSSIMPLQDVYYHLPPLFVMVDSSHLFCSLPASIQLWPTFALHFLNVFGSILHLGSALVDGSCGGFLVDET